MNNLPDNRYRDALDAIREAKRQRAIERDQVDIDLVDEQIRRRQEKKRRKNIRARIHPIDLED